MFLFQKIEEIIIHYDDARETIGNFLMNEKDNIQNYTMQEIADKTFSSKATLVRFAKTLGFNGWRDFMKAFREEIHYLDAHKSDVDVNFPFHEVHSMHEIIQNMKILQIESIQDTVDLMNEMMVKQAVDILVKAEYIVIFGLSPNIYLGELFKRKLISIGKKIEIASQDESGLIARTLKPTDCAIFISYSGENRHSWLKQHLMTVKRGNVKVIGITCGGDNFVRQNSDCVLTISSKERLYTKISTFATEQSIMFILNVLFAGYFSKNYRQHFEYKIENSKILERQRVAILSQMKEED